MTDTENKEKQPPKPKSITSDSLRPVMPKVENNEDKLKQENDKIFENKNQNSNGSPKPE